MKTMLTINYFFLCITYCIIYMYYIILFLLDSIHNHIIYIIRTNVLEHTRHTSALTVAQKHNETFQRNMYRN